LNGFTVMVFQKTIFREDFFILYAYF